MAGMRRSEVSARRWADVADAADGDGVLVTVRRSKTNQEGEVRDVRFVKGGVARAIRICRAGCPPGAPCSRSRRSCASWCSLDRNGRCDSRGKQDEGADGASAYGAGHEAARDPPPTRLDRPPTNPPSCRGLRGSTTRRRARRPPPRLAYVAERQGWARCPRGPSFRAQGSPASGAAPGPRRRGPMAGGARTAMKPPPATSPALS